MGPLLDTTPKLCTPTVGNIGSSSLNDPHLAECSFKEINSSTTCGSNYGYFPKNWFTAA